MVVTLVIIFYSTLSLRRRVFYLQQVLILRYTQDLQSFAILRTYGIPPSP